MRENTDAVERREAVDRPRETDPVQESPTETAALRAAYDADIGGARRPRDLPNDFVAEHLARIRAVETAEPTRFHGIRKHLDVQEPDLRKRLDARLRSTGADAIRDAGLEHVTGFRSPEAFAMAEARSWRYAEAMGKREAAEARGEMRFDVQMPARSVLGKRFAEHVHGVSLAEDGTIVPTRFDEASSIDCRWKRADSGEWVVHTCFPDPRRQY